MSGDNPEKVDIELAPTESRAVGEEILKHEIDADEALQVVTGQDAVTLQLDADTERRLLRKIDWNLMPVLLRFMFA